MTLPLPLTSLACNLNLAHCGGLWAAFALLADVLVVGLPARAAVTEAWVQRYSLIVSNSIDRAFTVVSDTTGDIIVAGSTDDGNSGQDMLTIKYSGKDGSVVWQKRYNGPGNGDDSAQALAVDGSGNVVVTGTSQGEFYTAKYAATDGTLLWEKRYDGPGGEGDFAHAIAVDGSGSVVVTGSSNNAMTIDQSGNRHSETDFYTAKYAAADGTLLWEKRYNGAASSDDSAQALAVDRSGNVIVTGSSYNSIMDEFGSLAHQYTAKYAAADGTLLWEKRFPIAATDHSVAASAVTVDGGGNVVVTGSSVSSENGSDFYTAKYAAANGALLWEKSYNGPGNSEDQARVVAVDNHGNVIVTGYSHNGEPRSDTDYYTAKYAAADGALLWERRYNGPGNEIASPKALAVDGAGNVVVTGMTGFCDGSWGCFYDGYTAKYAAADGTLLWEKRSTHGFAEAVTMDAGGNVVVTGFSSGSGSRDDYYTAKYATADGALLWEKQYNSTANNDDEAVAVAMDSSGNVVVTGSSPHASDSDGFPLQDYYTAKYAAADGALLWEKRFPGNYGDGARAVAIDRNGDVVVTGYSQAQFYTAKYSAKNGTLLWEKRIPGGYWGDGGRAVAIERNGDVTATGAFQSDYYTAKYGAANGALLWEKRYNGPPNREDRASAVALDSSGNVAVTGFSWNVTNPDYYTAKYAAADGALLWEKRYNGPGNREDYADGLAMDDVGNVVVTGTSQGEFYTVKYAAANGVLLWEKRSNAPGYAKSVAVDGKGNVVVTGISDNPAPNYNYGDFYTAKYAAVNGAMLWEKRYNGPPNSINQAQALALDSTGNVVVTGTSRENGWDFYTVEYAAADGALLWEMRYSGAAKVYNSANAVAVDGNGNVAVTGSSGRDYATIFYRKGLPAVLLDLLPSGIRLRFSGNPGLSYNLERATAITGPWIKIDTQIAPGSNLLEYLDASAPLRQAFYRTVQP